MSSVDQKMFAIQQQIANLYSLSKPPPPINIQPLEDKIQEQAQEISLFKNKFEEQKDEINDLKIALAAKTEDLNQLKSQVSQLIVECKKITSIDILKEVLPKLTILNLTD